MSDWSSDVCSSDLGDRVDRMQHERGQLVRHAAGVDEVALQLLVRILGELSAMATGEGAEFLELDRGFGVAHDHPVAIDANDLGPALAGDRKSTRLNSSH